MTSSEPQRQPYGQSPGVAAAASPAARRSRPATVARVRQVRGGEMVAGMPPTGGAPGLAAAGRTGGAPGVGAAGSGASFSSGSFASCRAIMASAFSQSRDDMAGSVWVPGGAAAAAPPETVGDAAEVYAAGRAPVSPRP